jgi:hypothetical protein
MPPRIRYGSFVAVLEGALFEQFLHIFYFIFRRGSFAPMQLALRRSGTLSICRSVTRPSLRGQRAARLPAISLHSHSSGGSEAEPEYMTPPPTRLEEGAVNNDILTQRDRAFLRAVACRPELPEGNIYEADDVADHALLCKWHEKAWEDLLNAQ